MIHILEKYEICLLQTINGQLESIYTGEIIQELRQILLQAIVTGQMEEEKLKRLEKLLLQFDEKKAKEFEINEADRDFLLEWPGWREAEETELKRKILYLHHDLSKRLLMQYAVYQKQILHKKSKGIGRILDPVIGIEREY